MSINDPLVVRRPFTVEVKRVGVHVNVVMVMSDEYDAMLLEDKIRHCLKQSGSVSLYVNSRNIR